MQYRFVPIRVVAICVVLVGLALALGNVSGIARHALAAGDPVCNAVTMPVALLPDAPASYHIAGWLCTDGTTRAETVQVMVSGGTYTHVYWDFPYQPERYSYLRSAVQAGYAVFNFDRIGQGASDHPLSQLVTIQSNAYVLHQLIQDLRAGQIGGRAFQKIVVAGHSLGSAITIVEASSYPGDVDGVIITGFLHTLNSVMPAVLSTDTLPAQLDPQFAGGNYSVGYLTTKSGTRGALFYYQPNVDPNVLTTDESTKGTYTDGEGSTFFSQIPLTLSQQIHVPVLIAVGTYDQFFCEGTALAQCATTASVQSYEASYFSPDAHLQIVVLPNAGHDINLQENAQTWFTQATTWVDTYVGN
ncbi:MAG: alpha/beta hydrolase [Chloroflexota bacterium]|nr:alpha/beta hydrolase [Chloroflexota bacterium]